MPFLAVLFDFDGTLGDSFAAITASTNHVRQSYRLPAVSEEIVRQYVGYGLPNLMEKLVPGADVEEAVGRYREHHTSVMFTDTKLMPGVATTLPILHQRGYALGVCSNKAVVFTRQLVESCGLAALMRLVLGPDDVAGRAKPDPAMLLEAVSRLGLARDQVLYVGDMAIDVHTAHAAGMPVWIVLGGAAGHESVADAQPDRVLADFAQLLDLLPSLH